MRQRLLIFGAAAVVVVALLAINTASYVKLNRPPETEAEPDRSTYNAGPTGTRALYDFLQENGQRVMRWQEASSTVDTLEADARPAVWVIVGPIRKAFSDEEVAALLHWVSRGGRLMLIDRYPEPELMPPSAKWNLSVLPVSIHSDGPANENAGALTAGVKPIAPAEPTLLVQGVEQVQTSRFASSIEFSRASDTPSTTTKITVPDPGEGDEGRDDEPPPPASPKGPVGPAAGPIVVDEGPPVTAPPAAAAPVVHLSQAGRAVLVDYPHGAGRIIILSDPYMVANGGLNLADNLLLARNLVSTNGGLIAFDEFHQGHAISQNHLAAYFAGTPVLPILGQIAFIVLVIMWTRSRRFGRALPLVQPDRRSKLEYVASMAELQQRSRAFDLAVENIYLRTRRALARYAGVDGNSPRATIAQRVAARSKIDQHQLETVMRQCEDAINGEPTNAKQALWLVARLREIETALGIKFRQREAKQAREL